VRSAAVSLSERLYAAAGSVVLVSIGAFSVCWGIITFPVFWHDASLNLVADRILDGQQFKREVLQTLLADGEPADGRWARPEALRSAAVIRLRLAEQAGKVEGLGALSPIYNQLGVGPSIRRSLSAAPADPFLWLALFRLQEMNGDHSQQDFAYLKMSYLVGPREGWVAVKRNRMALAAFPELSPDLADLAVTEFKDLVASGYYDAAVEILAGPGWPIRDTLLRRLQEVPDEARRQFARLAAQLGYEIAVPGIERGDWRPW
jgi:hypothetical protein